MDRSWARLAAWVVGVPLVLVGCGDEDVAAVVSGGEGSGAVATVGMGSASGSGADGTAGETGFATAGGDSDTGNGGGGADGGDTGGVGGDTCQPDHSGLCEEIGQTVHCYSGAEGTCDVGQCVGGTQTCTIFDLDLGEWTACEGEVLPELEVCDGSDNDCDGETDEDLGQTQCGLGVCEHTVDNCVDGAEQTCDAFDGASPEICDGLDNDCDGDIDEDFDGLTVTCGLGVCEHDVAECEAGMMPTCDPFEGASPEVCDGLDNDCDGATDEGLGTDNCGLGVCNHTVDLCVAGMPNVCDPFEGAMPEVCDGLDNDCDGAIDEGFDPVTCGLGECEHQSEQCVLGVPIMCDPFEGAVPEICDDGLDNDCDGMIDEGCVCGNGVVGGSEQCDAPDLGGQTCVTLGHDGGTLACLPNCTFDESGCYDCGDGSIDPGESCDGADLGGQTCVTLGHDGGPLACDAACNFDESGCYDCGDGVLDPGEVCDGADLGGQTCVTQGFDGGVLACDAACGLDTSGCYQCGDGSIDPGESCDGADLGGQTCVSQGFDGGVLACDAACGFDTSGCYQCGDGSIDPGESCDGANLGGQTCVTQGFAGGTLACDAACGFDTSGCYLCGDGMINPGEQCDGADVGGLTCVGLGYDGGTLGCTAGCLIDPSGCFSCGDGAIDPGEQCDGMNVGGQTCVGLGYDGGTLGCSAACGFDVSGCWLCGDGLLNPGEACDGPQLGGQTCVTQGFDGGTLACNASCGFDTSGCYECGDGAIDPGESCDGAALAGQTCISLGFDGGTLTCDGTCSFDTSGCYECGNGVVDPGEDCDGADLGGGTCAGLGFPGGILGCDASCNYDLTGCMNCGNGVLDPPEECDGIDFGGQDCNDFGFSYGNLSCDANCMVDTSNCTDTCEAPAMHLVCDTPGGDPLQAIGLGCAGDATNSTQIANLTFDSPDTAAYRVAAEYGTSGTWVPKEGNALLVLTTGTLPALDAFDRVVVPAGSTEPGTANLNPGAFGAPIGLAAPISAVDGSNFGLGGTPFVNCDLVDDCSDSLDTQWVNGGAGAYDRMYFQFDVTVPGGTSAFAFDFAWFDSEYPEWIGSIYSDIFVVWSQSEAYTGNIMVNFGQSFSSNTAAPFINYSDLDPELVGTGYEGLSVGGATGWYTVTAPTVPGEPLTLTFSLFETGDDLYDGTVLLDNFRWDCDGCIMGNDCLMVPAP